MCNSLSFSLIIVLLFSHRVKRYKKIVFEFYFFSTYLSVRWHSIEVQGGIVARFLFNFVWEFVGDGQKWHSIEGGIVKGWHSKEV